MRILIVLFTLLLTTSTHQSSTVDSSDSSDDTTTESIKTPLIVKSIDKANGLPKETQMAQCTVTSGDIKASAHATFSKKLEGFCSTQDMTDLNDYLNSIENRLLYEIHSLRKMVQTLLPNNNYQRNSYDSYYDSNHVQHYPSNNDYYRDQRRNYEEQRNPYNSRDRYYYENSRSDDNRRRYDDNSYDDRRYYEKSADSNRQQNLTTSTERPYESSRKAPEVVAVPSMMLKSLESSRVNKSAILATSTELPTTTEDTHEQLSSAKMEYIYHWKLDNFPKVFTVDMKSEVYSHVFNVKGLFLRIRAAWNQLDEESLVLDIEHLANVDNIDKFEIEISDGLVFKEIAEEKLFQYSFAIIDQSKPNHDLISPIYWNTDSDTFDIRNSLVLLNNYVKNDSLLIKLIISF